MKVYKLFRLGQDKKIYPLFINRKQETRVNEWLQADCFPTKGFAVRKGWHCCLFPLAPHLKEELANGEKRVWVECEAEDAETYKRPESQGGAWVLAQRLKVIRVLSEEEVLNIRKSV